MIKYVVKYCHTYLFITLINAILASTVPVLYILLTRYIVDSITDGSNFSNVILIILAFLMSDISYCFFNVWMQQKVIPTNTQILNQRMQEDIFVKALSLDLECYENAEFYTKFSMALQQSDSRALSVLNTFSTLIGTVLGVVSLITIISSFEPIILIFTAVNVAITFYSNTKSAVIQHDYYEKKVPLLRETGYIQRVYYLRDYAKELRIFDKFPSVMTEKYDSAIGKTISLVDTYSKKLARPLRVQGSCNATINAAIMLYLANSVYNKTLSLGNFIALSNSAQQLAGQISQLLNVFPQMYEHSMYIENFTEFMNCKPNIDNGGGSLDVMDNPIIELHNVSFSYPNTKKVILNNISLKISPGEKVALVGKNGAGKSTLIKLIARLYEPSEGLLMLDGKPYSEYNLHSLRQKIGIVHQDYQLFAVSISENILMRPISSATDEEKVKEALELVGLYDKVCALPNGADTVLSKEFSNSGAIFSGGEFQKLAIARAYAQNSDIIILDEPSSALDPFAENEIINLVFDFAVDKTVILISHRLTNVKNVNKIILLKDGSLLESGPHDDLMKINGEYAAMYTTQANKYRVS